MTSTFTTPLRLATAALVLLAAAAPVQGQGGDRHHGKDRGRHQRPLVLKEQGSFLVGGHLEPADPASTTPNDPRFTPGDIAVGQLYVQYQVPQRLRYRYPLVLVHGGGHTGKTYETTPDGREGWFTSFTRRGFAPFNVDMPNRGRSGFDPRRFIETKLGLADPDSLHELNIYSAQAAWVAFRFGPEYGVQYPGQQFPVEHLEQYVRQLVPAFRDPDEIGRITDAVVALIDSLGPVILLGHSQGGRVVFEAASRRPRLVKGVIGIEPAGPALYENLEKVPLLWVVGDNNPPESAIEYTDSLRARGGDATTIVLPEVGIRGNSHMMMMERNNEKIADLLEDWIGRHVKRVRRR